MELPRQSQQLMTHRFNVKSPNFEATTKQRRDFVKLLEHTKRMKERDLEETIRHSVRVENILRNKRFRS